MGIVVLLARGEARTRDALVSALREPVAVVAAHLHALSNAGVISIVTGVEAAAYRLTADGYRALPMVAVVLRLRA